MAKTAYEFTALTGGAASALDSVDGDVLLDGDFALITASGFLYIYTLDDDLGGAESSPDVIAPDTNPGNKRWVLHGFSGADLSLAVGAVINFGAGDVTITHSANTLAIAGLGDHITLPLDYGFKTSAGNVIYGATGGGTYVGPGGNVVFFGNGVLNLAENLGPGAPAANSCNLYARDNGSGKTQLCVMFSNGTPIVLATSA